MGTHPDPRPALDALSDLKDRLLDALDEQHPPESPTLARELEEVFELAEWCRGAGLAWVRSGDFTWREIAEETGIPYQTLQQRWTKWWEERRAEGCD